MSINGQKRWPEFVEAVDDKAVINRLESVNVPEK
jgi:hypothetical protein